MKACNLLRKTMCATCPFRPESPLAHLAAGLAEAGLSESRVCHSTGSSVFGRTGKKRHLCRGVRDMQLRVMASMGAIDAPTDESWNRARVAIGLKPLVVIDP